MYRLNVQVDEGYVGVCSVIVKAYVLELLHFPFTSAMRNGAACRTAVA